MTTVLFSLALVLLTHCTGIAYAVPEGLQENKPKPEAPTQQEQPQQPVTYLSVMEHLSDDVKEVLDVVLPENLSQIELDEDPLGQTVYELKEAGTRYEPFGLAQERNLNRLGWARKTRPELPNGLPSFFSGQNYWQWLTPHASQWFARPFIKF